MREVVVLRERACRPVHAALASKQVIAGRSGRQQNLVGSGILANFDGEDSNLGAQPLGASVWGED